MENAYTVEVREIISRKFYRSNLEPRDSKLPMKDRKRMKEKKRIKNRKAR